VCKSWAKNVDVIDPLVILFFQFDERIENAYVLLKHSTQILIGGDDTKIYSSMGLSIYDITGIEMPKVGLSKIAKYCVSFVFGPCIQSFFFNILCHIIERFFQMKI